MKRYLVYLPLWISLLLFFSCNPQLKQLDMDRLNAVDALGPVDFSNYIAYGNSLTAGSADNALYRKGQENSYVALFAKQLQAASLNKNFNIPYMPSNNGLGNEASHENAYTPGMKGRQIFKGFENNAPKLIFAEADPQGFDPAAAIAGNASSFHNLGVPGMRISAINELSFRNTNAFFRRLEVDNKAQTYLDMVKRTQPSFFTVWLGANDVLSYAVAGGEAGEEVITDLTTFRDNYKAFLNAIFEGRENPPKGLVFSVPNVLSAPYFTTIPSNVFPMATQEAVQSTLGLFGALKDMGKIEIDTQKIDLQIRKDNYALVLHKDQAGKIHVRQLQKEDRVLLPFSKALGNTLVGLGAVGTALAANPTGLDVALEQWYTGALKETHVLDRVEQEKIINNINLFNDAIYEVCRDHKDHVRVIDVNKAFEAVEQGIVLSSGFRLTPQYITGGMFSLDGIHLTPLGNAYVANLLIKEVNRTFNQRISQLRYSEYDGVLQE